MIFHFMSKPNKRDERKYISFDTENSIYMAEYLHDIPLEEYIEVSSKAYEQIEERITNEGYVYDLEWE